MKSAIGLQYPNRVLPERGRELVSQGGVRALVGWEYTITIHCGETPLDFVKDANSESKELARRFSGLKDSLCEESQLCQDERLSAEVPSMSRALFSVPYHMFHHTWGFMIEPLNEMRGRTV